MNALLSAYYDNIKAETFAKPYFLSFIILSVSEKSL